jgi:deoxyribonuclease-4
MSGPEYYLGSVKEALSYGANTFMFYTGAPQNSYRKPLGELRIEEGRKAIAEAGIDESKIIVHAPYIINIGNNTNPAVYDSSRSS